MPRSSGLYHSLQDIATGNQNICFCLHCGLRTHESYQYQYIQNGINSIVDVVYVAKD
jgi:hypothetical protein